MLLLFQEQQPTLLNNRDKLLQKLESKYVQQIHSLLQQKILISTTIIRQHDEMLNEINQNIYECINNQLKATKLPISNNINTIATTCINPQLNLPTLILETLITSQSNENNYKSNIKTENHNHNNVSQSNDNSSDITENQDSTQ